MKIKIIEAFQTFQGEGRDTGQRMLILRFKKCNRTCKFGKQGECDTALRMRISAEFDLSIKEIQKLTDENNTGILITGGEPTFSTNLKQTAEIINEVNCHLFNVETNGHKLIKLIEQVNPEKNIHYTLSPKIFNNKDMEEYLPIVEKIKNNPNVFIKVVYEQRDLLTKFLDHLRNIDFDNRRVYLMPEGTNRETILAHASMVFDAAEKYKFNFSSREHIIYGFV